MTSTRNASKYASRLFISYRRQDSEQAASRLAADLRQRFGRKQVFQGFASIDPGADVVDTVQRGLDTCAVVLVVIGPKWLSVVNADGGRRIDADGDWVRYEVAESLRRPGVRAFSGAGRRRRNAPRQGRAGRPRAPDAKAGVSADRSPLARGCRETGQVFAGRAGARSVVEALGVVGSRLGRVGGSRLLAVLPPGPAPAAGNPASQGGAAPAV